jgi:UDP-GlcNAc:undecaprenyl-phosphate GlcNAc-1-phosphate transferase
MAIVRRTRAGRSPFAADSEHLHHRLLAMGNSHRRTTVILYAFTAFFAVPPVVAAFLPLWTAFLTGVVILGFAIFLIRDSLGKNQINPNNKALDNSMKSVEVSRKK